MRVNASAPPLETVAMASLTRVLACAFKCRAGSGCADVSGDAVDHFWRYPDDIRMLRDLGSIKDNLRSAIARNATQQHAANG